MQYESTLLIDAPVALVWELTTDVTRWPEFTPTIQRIELLDSGPLRVDSRVRVKQPGQTAAIWTVTDLEPGRRYVWQARRLGLTMVGAHVLEQVDGGCRNTLSIELTGWGAGLFGLLFGAAIRRAIARENEGFREQAELVARDASTGEG